MLKPGPVLMLFGSVNFLTKRPGVKATNPAAVMFDATVDFARHEFLLGIRYEKKVPDATGRLLKLSVPTELFINEQGWHLYAGREQAGRESHHGGIPRRLHRQRLPDVRHGDEIGNVAETASTCRASPSRRAFASSRGWTQGLALQAGVLPEGGPWRSASASRGCSWCARSSPAALWPRRGAWASSSS